MNPALNRNEMKLCVHTGNKYLRVASSFVENASMSFGMGGKSSLAMSLAAEEIFLHICSTDKPCPVELTMTDLVYKTVLDFSFNASGVNMSAFNITAKASADITDESMSHTGLLIAARSVDSFDLVDNGGGSYILRVEKEKVYPASTFDPASFVRPESVSWRMRRPTHDEVMVLVSLLNVFRTPEDSIPPFLRIPGKVADMLESGAIDAAASYSEGNSPCGVIFWRQKSSKAVECFGPYCFLSDLGDTLSRELIGFFLGCICKDNYYIVESRYMRESWAKGYFETLHGIPGCLSRPVFYRQVKDDPGATLWVSWSIDKFVRHEKARLFLPRNIILQEQHGVSHSQSQLHGEYSVIFTKLDRENGSAVMRPVRPGTDIQRNIEGHLDLLRSESFNDIVFELDLGISWHCVFADALVLAGFEPEFLLPSAGTADVISLRYTKDIKNTRLKTIDSSHGAL